MRVVAALASCLAVVAAAGCGGSAKSTKTAAGTTAAPQAALVDAGLESPGGCFVTVLLAEGATKAQVAQVQRQLLATRGVTEVAFVSKELALRRFAVLNPTAAKGMRPDQFANRFEVVPAARGSVSSIVGGLAKGGPIAGAKPSTGCSGPA